MTWHPVNDSALENSTVNAAALTGSYLFVGTGLGAWRAPINYVVTSVANRPHALPGRFALNQNYPNPFNPSIVISYQLSAVSHVTLNVYDVLGRQVRMLVDEVESPGAHKVTFNAAGLASGVCSYRISAVGNNGRAFMAVKRLMLLK